MSACLAAGRVADAERILGWLDEMVPRLPCAFPRIAAATGRAQLAEFRGDRDGAHGHYRSALALHDEVDLPIEHCETLLAYGGFLRRAGQAVRARPVLAREAQVAQGAVALWLAGFAHAELKVAGGRLRRHAPPGTLSPQEERVAALVATGAANADIARQLYLSVSTVETHLERIYAKLGIHTRYQLIAMTAGRQPGHKDSGTFPIPWPATRCDADWNADASLHWGNHMLTQSLPPREMHARPNCAPAYYQGRPATLWIAVMRPQTRRTAAGHTRTTRHPVAVPRPRRPRAGETIPPTPRLSAVHWAMGR